MADGNRRRTRLRIAAFVLSVCGVAAAIVGVGALAGAAVDGALLGGGAIAVVVAVSCAVLAMLGFRRARPGATSVSVWGPLLLTLLLAVVGVIGSMVMFTVSSAAISRNGVAVAIVILLLSLVATITGLALGRLVRASDGASVR